LWNALSLFDPVVSAVFALELPVNPTILGLLGLGDLTNIHAVTFRTDNRHSQNKPFDIILSLRLAFANIKVSAFANIPKTKLNQLVFRPEVKYRKSEIGDIACFNNAVRTCS